VGLAGDAGNRAKSHDALSVSPHSYSPVTLEHTMSIYLTLLSAERMKTVSYRLGCTLSSRRLRKPVRGEHPEQKSTMQRRLRLHVHQSRHLTNKSLHRALFQYFCQLQRGAYEPVPPTEGESSVNLAEVVGHQYADAHRQRQPF
jgi:hypothetical protein